MEPSRLQRSPYLGVLGPRLGCGVRPESCSAVPEVRLTLFLEGAGRFRGFFGVHSGELHAQRERQNHARHETHVVIDRHFRGHNGFERPGR